VLQISRAVLVVMRNLGPFYLGAPCRQDSRTNGLVAVAGESIVMVGEGLAW